MQNDEHFNPYAFPDFGGIADLPDLHHTANWHNRGTASLALRVETVFMTGGRVRSRPPRVLLMWALASYLRSLPAPAPVAAPSPASERARRVFSEAGCDACHNPPLYTSDERPTLAEIGTHAAAGTRPIRGIGRWRVPSLRGVGGNGPQEPVVQPITTPRLALPPLALSRNLAVGRPQRRFRSSPATKGPARGTALGCTTDS